MKYRSVFLDAIGYELAPVVVTSEDLERRLQPLYETVRLLEGHLEALTGVGERRWWEPGYPLAEGAIQAARKCLERSKVPPEAVQMVVYGGVCREELEPAMACQVAAALGINRHAHVYDVSNACLGVVNGMIDVANRIELGQVRAGLVASCESAREIIEATIDDMLEHPSLDLYKRSLATLTGGSGAVAVLLTDGSFASEGRRRLLGGSIRTAPEHHRLSRWRLAPAETHEPGSRLMTRHVLETDSAALLRYGVDLACITYGDFLAGLGWSHERVDKVICHQVGSPHRDAVLSALGLREEQDFATFPYLGNMGTVSLPMTAGLAEERGFLRPGDHVGLLGIGSGLNCLMLGVEW